MLASVAHDGAVVILLQYAGIPETADRYAFPVGFAGPERVALGILHEVARGILYRSQRILQQDGVREGRSGRPSADPVK